jgi:hypothetical protein
MTDSAVPQITLKRRLRRAVRGSINSALHAVRDFGSLNGVPHGVIAADDISWNESLWDFADKHRLPGYNYRATMGVAFLTGNRGAVHAVLGGE